MDAADSPFLYFVGTAGSGKTTMMGAFDGWCKLKSISTTLVNLDPGVEALPYAPDVDIREWFTVESVMRDHGLGPNGAQLAAADMLALHAGELRKILQGYSQDFVLVDTPGQIELFGFRSSSQVLLNTLSPSRAMLVFLMDPNLVTTPSGFISSSMLWATVASRFLVPTTGVLSKADILEPHVLERICRWARDADLLYSDATLAEQNMNAILNAEVFKALETLGLFQSIAPASALESYGMDDIYAAVQNVFAAGEDIVE